MIIRQAMSRGFTVWFKPEGNKNKKLGIRYPVGIKNSGPPIRYLRREQDSEEFRQLIEASLKEFEITTPGKDDVTSVPIVNTIGIEVKVGQRNERMVYELKVPLTESADHPYAIGVIDHKSIRIGFEVEEFDRSLMKKNMGKGDRPPFGGGGREGGMGGPPGGKGMPPGGGRHGPEMPERMKFDIKVQLAEKNQLEATDITNENF
jgi:hypothetical protein